MSWWFRLRRLWAQDRIRLSAADWARPRIEVGDRLEILGQLWKVEGRRRLADAPAPSTGVAAIFELETLGGGPKRHARLHHGARQGAATGWWFEDAAGRRPMAWSEVVHYRLRRAAWTTSQEPRPGGRGPAP